MSGDAHRAVEAIWRIESAKIIAALTRMVRDVGLAEELAQDALVSALETWPRDGSPDNPGAWLMATAKNRALDHFRHGRMHAEKEGELTWEIETALTDAQPDVEAHIDDPVRDDLLRLIFIACHPLLSPEALSRVAARDRRDQLEVLRRRDAARELRSRPSRRAREANPDRHLAPLRIGRRVPAAGGR